MCRMDLNVVVVLVVNECRMVVDRPELTLSKGYQRPPGMIHPQS